MAQIKSFCKNHIYALTFFAFLVLYNFVVVLKCKLPVISGVVYSFHAVDYSMGFCSKLLVGSIFNFFHNEISQEKVLIYELLLMILLFVAVAVFCEKLLKKAPTEDRRTAFLVIFFFLSGPGTFAQFMRDLGTLDVYWLFITILFFVCLSNKHLYPLLIIPFVICVLVHFASLICFIPFFVIITLYKLSCTENKNERKKLWICLTVSAVSAVALAVYFVMYEKSNVTYTIDEFHKILESKGVEHFRYYDWYLYQVGESELKGHIEEFEVTQGLWYGIRTVFQQIQYTVIMLYRYPEFLDNVSKAFMVALPVSVFLFAFIIQHIKNNHQCRFKVFVLCLALMLFLATPLAGLMFSLDYVRWFVHAFISLFVTVFYVCYTEKQSLWSVFQRIIQKVPTLVMLLYFVVYAVNTYDLYS